MVKQPKEGLVRLTNGCIFLTPPLIHCQVHYDIDFFGFQGDFLGLSKLPEVKRPSSLLLEPNTNQVRSRNYLNHQQKPCVCITVINHSFLVLTAVCAQPGRAHWPSQVQARKAVECPSAPQVLLLF